MSKDKFAHIPKRKKFEALFDRGGYVRFNRDSEGRPLIDPEMVSDDDMRIFVGPPSPLQREMAVREAQATRARVMLEARDDEDSTTYVTIRNYIRGMKRDALIDYILDLDENEHYTQARRDVLQQKDWEDFNAFRDAMRQWEEAGSPLDSEEWKPLLDRDAKFGRDIEGRASEIRADAHTGYMHMAVGLVQEKAIEKRIDQIGSAAFMVAYEEWILFYSCRDDEDHLELYFEKPEDIKRLPEKVQAALATKAREFVTDVSEAKN